MQMLFGVLIAVAPFGVVLGLFAWASRRERLGREVRARQIALTDVVHERLGAVAAPVVRRRRRGWQVRIAVPFERPAAVEALLTIVREALAPVEIVLTRQVARPGARATKLTGAGNVGEESPSWT